MPISIDDLIDSDDKATAVYLAILYLRFHPAYRINFFRYHTTTPNEILKVYFTTRSRDDIEQTMKAFHHRFDHALLLDSGQLSWRDDLIMEYQVPSQRDQHRYFQNKKELLEELEERYFSRFKEAFERYVRLKNVPDDFREATNQFLQYAKTGAIGEDFTRSGSTIIPYNQLSLVAEDRAEFIDILRKSRIAFKHSFQRPFDGETYDPLEFNSVIVPSVVLDLLIKQKGQYGRIIF